MQRAGWVVAGLLALGARQPNTTPKAEVATAQKRVVAAPAQPATAVVPGRPFVGYHRYRGTVGGQAVVVELTVEPPAFGDSASCQGTYYYEQHGAALQLNNPAGSLFTAPLRLAESRTHDQPAVAYWQATQPVGPVLTGTWTSADQRRRVPFALREDYTGAMPYELLYVRQQGAEGPPSEERVAARTLEAGQLFLHLLGPDTLRPSLCRLQCPTPAKRRALVADLLAEADCENELYGASVYQTVTLNGYGLLSTLVTTDSGESSGTYSLDVVNAPRTYDLTTGQLCPVKSWLLPEADAALNKLFFRHLAADYPELLDHLSPENRRAHQAPVFDLGLKSEGV